MRILLVLLVAGCAAAAPDQGSRCEAEADQDPVVRSIRMRGAGSETFKMEHEDDLRIARNDAVQACVRGRGTVPTGVERQKRPV